MLNTARLSLGYFALLLFCGLASRAQTALTIGGDVPAPLTVSADELSKMPHEKATFEHDGQTATYEGVLLYDLLVKAGVPFGKNMTGKPMASYLLLTARDGYQVVFALPELDPKFAGARVLLADRRNGGPLPEKEQPFRIIAPQDKMKARSTFAVVKAEVVRLRK
jgi:hypothetical protein